MEPFKLFPFQARALESLAATQIHLAVTSPTGSGKGLILERLAADPRERILLITPLIALGRQQRMRLERSGVACKTNSEARVGARVWICSPESITNPVRAKELRDWRATLIAVDEAHCLQEWGDQFRPAYRHFLKLLTEVSPRRTLWMSATFPRRMLFDLKEALPGPWEIQGKFQISENLSVLDERIASPDRVEKIRAVVNGLSGPGLVFAGTRKNVGHYLDVLSGTRAFLPYHAGLSDEERRNVEGILSREALGQPGAKSVISTNAFGMGMDFPQFDWVVLAHTPFSVLGLMQCLGRVGRAHKRGTAALYWCEEDFRFAGLLNGTGTFARKANEDLRDLREYLEATPTRRASLLEGLFL